MIIYMKRIYMRLYNDLDNRIHLDVLYPLTHTQIHTHVVIPWRIYILLIYAHQTKENKSVMKICHVFGCKEKLCKVEILYEKFCLCALYKISNLKQNNPHFKEQIKMHVVLFADSETKYSYQNL